MQNFFLWLQTVSQHTPQVIILTQETGTNTQLIMVVHKNAQGRAGQNRSFSTLPDSQHGRKVL